MSAELLEFPDVSLLDIARGLRNLADSIEAGNYGDAHNVAWVVDSGHGKIELGLLGRAGEPGALGHFLFHLAARRLENGALGITP